LCDCEAGRTLCEEEEEEEEEEDPNPEDIGWLPTPEDIAEKWKGIGWHAKGCDKDTETDSHHNHPAATAYQIAHVCSLESEQTTNHCTCVVAKAHSCYVKCRDSRGGGDEMHLKWQTCMANCYPSPTCSTMCAAVGAECEQDCVKRYRSVVDPFKKMFADANTSVAEFEGFTLPKSA